MGSVKGQSHVCDDLCVRAGFGCPDGSDFCESSSRKARWGRSSETANVVELSLPGGLSLKSPRDARAPHRVGATR
jgi:hypothetical protein